MTQNKITVIAGRNGCGKSQLLSILHSFRNTQSDEFLQNIGYRTYFPKDRAHVSISGPTRIYHLAPTRALAKDPDERKGGAYTFDQLATFNFWERYGRFRKTLSKLAMDAECYSRKDSEHANQAIRVLKKQLLASVLDSANQLLPDLKLEIIVDHNKREVSVFSRRSGMPFVRPNDARFGDELRIPFGTISDGELNVLFLTYELLYHASEATTPALVLIDEIENHLHPSLLTRFMSLMPSLLPDHMMVIATTHSPQVITSVPATSRVLMIHSSEAFAGKHSNQLLTSTSDASAAAIFYDLYGADSRQAAMFLANDVQNATSGDLITYAQQSLLDSEIFSTSKPSDPQRTFLAGLVHARKTSHGSLRTLDFGAGHGRLIQGLRQDVKATSGGVIHMDVVEENADCQLTLKSLALVTGTPIEIGQIYASANEVPMEARFDLILLHNVVHELPPGVLLDMLELVDHTLEVDGVVNLLEQSVLPDGERSFFVFSPKAFATLFDAIGLVSTVSSRVSRTGVPIYELSAHRSQRRKIDRADLRARLAQAIHQTLADNLLAFESLQASKTRPIEYGFLALNMANGRIKLRSLEAN